MEPRLVRFEGFEGIHLVARRLGRPRRLAGPAHARRRADPSRVGRHGRTLADTGGGRCRSTCAATATASGRSTATTRSARSRPTAIAVADQLGRPPVLVGASLGGVARDHRRGRQRPRRVERARDRRHHAPLEPRGHPAHQGLHELGHRRLRHARGRRRRDRRVHAEPAKRANPAGLMKVLRQKPDGRWYWHWDPAFIARRRTPRCPSATSTRCSRWRSRGHPGADAARAREALRRRHRRGRRRSSSTGSRGRSSPT